MADATPSCYPHWNFAVGTYECKPHPTATAHQGFCAGQPVKCPPAHFAQCVETGPASGSWLCCDRNNECQNSLSVD